jgi:dephospho-CoA kinase
MINLQELNIIGLTGISGAGKSLAARIFAERGFFVIDCDKEARRVIAAPKCAESVRDAFPEAYASGEFDRVKMARLVFTDEKKLKSYERIIFPFIIFKILQIILLQAQNTKNILLDAPTLFQSGANDFCRKIIAVAADKKLCAARITERDGISEADALMRLNSQPDAEFYRSRADYFIENNDDRKDFIERIKKTCTITE